MSIQTVSNVSQYLGYLALLKIFLIFECITIFSQQTKTSTVQQCAGHAGGHQGIGPAGGGDVAGHLEHGAVQGECLGEYHHHNGEISEKYKCSKIHC